MQLTGARTVIQESRARLGRFAMPGRSLHAPDPNSMETHQ